jgi:hypothetical protein
VKGIASDRLAGRDVVACELCCRPEWTERHGPARTNKSFTSLGHRLRMGAIRAARSASTAQSKRPADDAVANAMAGTLISGGVGAAIGAAPKVCFKSCTRTCNCPAFLRAFCQAVLFM